MSHTYRNRHTVPKGAVVRDGGDLYWPDCCPNKKAKWASHRSGCGCYWGTGRRGRATKFRRGPLRQEKKSERVAHQRAYRAKVRDRMAHEDWEGIPRFCRTSGWLTW